MPLSVRLFTYLDSIAMYIPVSMWIHIVNSKFAMFSKQAQISSNIAHALVRSNYAINCTCWCIDIITNLCKRVKSSWELKKMLKQCSRMHLLPKSKGIIQWQFISTQKKNCIIAAIILTTNGDVMHGHIGSTFSVKVFADNSYRTNSIPTAKEWTFTMAIT